MSDTSATPSSNLLQLTARIVSAHVRHSTVAPDALPALIQSVYAALGGLGQAPAAPERPEPAVPWKRSVQPDYIVCLEDGAKLKTLKRYLATRYDMTPAQYRQRWGLPSDYPMVAPAYSAQRTALAKEIGLGRKPKAADPAPEHADPAPKPAAKRGRKAASEPEAA